MTQLSYSQALDIARKLANAQTKAAERLRAKCAATGRQPTFIIMRHGDPRNWVGRLPSKRDNRVSQVNETNTREVHVIGRTDIKIARRTKDWRAMHATRPVILQHVETGVIAKCPSIVDFCQMYLPDGSKSDRYHVTPVLDGDRPSFKGWYLPEILARVVKLRDIYDNVGSYMVRDLLTTHGLSSNAVFHLLSGKKRTAGNLMLADTPYAPAARPKTTKITEVTLVKGKHVIKAPSLPQAARKAGIETSMANVYSAAYGFKEEVRGFRIAEVKTERKQVIRG